MQPMNCERLSLFIMVQLGQLDADAEPLSCAMLPEPDWLISSVSAKRPTMTSTGSMPLEQVRHVEGEAGDAGDRIGADGGDHQADTLQHKAP